MTIHIWGPLLQSMEKEILKAAILTGVRCIIVPGISDAADMQPHGSEE